jgi:hypothetical protein
MQLAIALDQPKTIDLHLERLNRTIIQLALPSVLESVLTTLVYFVDTILISHLNKPAALAAVGLSSTLMWAADGLFQAISVSAMAMVARFWGQRDFEAARRAAGQALILSVLAAVLLMALLIPAARLYMELMGAELTVVTMGTQYIHILLATSVVSFPLSVANSIMRATGDTQKPMYITGLMNVINIAAAYVLIFGLGPIPRLELRGAALATSAARTLGGAIAIGILFSSRTPIHMRLVHLRRLDAGLIWRMVDPVCPGHGGYRCAPGRTARRVIGLYARLGHGDRRVGARGSGTGRAKGGHSRAGHPAHAADREWHDGAAGSDLYLLCPFGGWCLWRPGCDHGRYGDHSDPYLGAGAVRALFRDDLERLPARRGRHAHAHDRHHGGHVLVPCAHYLSLCHRPERRTQRPVAGNGGGLGNAIDHHVCAILAREVEDGDRVSWQCCVRDGE